MKLYDRKLSWKIFCLIGQGRTLSHAAQECGIDLPYASRLISKLEDELGFFLGNLCETKKSSKTF